MQHATNTHPTIVYVYTAMSSSKQLPAGDTMDIIDLWHFGKKLSMLTGLYWALLSYLLGLTGPFWPYLADWLNLLFQVWWFKQQATVRRSLESCIGEVSSGLWIMDEWWWWRFSDLQHNSPDNHLTDNLDAATAKSRVNLNLTQRQMMSVI